MSRLLDSLRTAQQERSIKSADSGSSGDRSRRRAPPEPGYFWSSLFWLMLLCGLIVGGFLLLQYQLHGIEPAQWLERVKSSF